MLKTTFRFGGAVDESSAAFVKIPTNVTSKAQLLDTLTAGLSFPDYFGGNWDALEELVQHLDWLPEGRVTILHEELPRLDAKSLATYLGILKRGTEKWRNTSERELCVIFPEGDREQVLAILASQPAPRGQHP